ncbi:MAG: hypothetical protein PHY64_01170 [Eubacteriales bacterium]|nr:hypothetical protein [Eubacteriales bacterium]
MKNDDIFNSINTVLSDLYISKPQGQKMIDEITGGKKVKTKLSTGLLLSMVLLLLIAGSAFALMRSGILDQMYGSQNTASQEAQQQLIQPNEEIQGENGVFVLNEYLFTGDSLYLNWTLKNLTDQQYMYTMSEFRANDTALAPETEPCLISDSFGYGQLLGGPIDGIDLTDSIEYTARYRGIGKDEFSVLRSSLEGKTITLSCQICIWKPLSAPVLAEKGYDTIKSIIGEKRLPTDSTGFCDLSGFIPDDNFTTYSAAEHEKVYQDLGWVQRIETVDCTFNIVLNSDEVNAVKPVQTVFDLQDCRYQIEDFQYSSMGGYCILRMYASTEALEAQRDSNVTLLDANTKVELTGGSEWGMKTDEEGTDYLSYRLELNPVSGALPDAVLIVPRTYQPEWDPQADDYDPASINPVNNTYWMYDMDRSVYVPLTGE